MHRVAEDLEETEEEDEKKRPANWRKVWNLIYEMRKGKTAPVDTMGASKQADKKEDANTYAY